MLPFYVQLPFMFLPFFYAGMTGHKLIDRIIVITKENHWIRLSLMMLSLGLLLFLYKYTSIPHKNEVISFCPLFYLYWLSGFLGIILLLFSCAFLERIKSKLIINISTATLFIMCSHYEIFKTIGGYLSSIFNDWISFFLVYCILLFFVF